MTTDTHPLLEEIAESDPEEYAQSLTHIGMMLSLGLVCYAAGYLTATRRYAGLELLIEQRLVPHWVELGIYAAIAIMILGLGTELFFRYS